MQLVRDGEPALAEVWQVPGKVKRKESMSERGKDVSFSTGPQSAPTHWKHTLFLLREPITADEGDAERFVLVDSAFNYICAPL